MNLYGPIDWSVDGSGRVPCYFMKRVYRSM